MYRVPNATQDGTFKDRRGIQAIKLSGRMERMLPGANLTLDGGNKVILPRKPPQLSPKELGGPILPPPDKRG